MGKGCLLGFIWEIKSLGDGRLCSANKVNMQIKEFIVLYAEKTSTYLHEISWKS